MKRMQAYLWRHRETAWLILIGLLALAGTVFFLSYTNFPPSHLGHPVLQ